MSNCKPHRKRHRYSPTSYERIVLRKNYDRYTYCLECGYRPVSERELENDSVAKEKGK